MYNIKPLNEISEVGLIKLPTKDFNVDKNIENPHGIILRSFDMHSTPINDELLAVARAGAGTNNVPIDNCTVKGVPVFNAPGGNANAVKELVLSALLNSSRKIMEGVQWTDTIKDSDTFHKDIEAGKKQFIGPEITGKTLGVIGLGAIGVLVSNSALDLGMNVVGYDPYLSLESAWHLSSAVVKGDSIEDLVSKCDYITIHVPLLDSTKHTINKELISHMKDGVRILNFARGELVNNQDILEAVKSGKVEKYMSDFPEKELLGIDNIICTPHLGASTPESEENCAVMATVALREYIYYGNIKNSVNFPNCNVPFNGKPRIAVSHKNAVNMIGQLAGVFTKYGINIDKLVNNSKGDLAYNIFVCDELPNNVDELVKDIYDIESVIKVRAFTFDN